MNKKLIGILLSLLVLTSCQLEKRHYLPGWSHGSGSAKIQTGAGDEPLMQAEIPFAKSEVKPETIIEPDSQVVPAPCEGCDTLYLKDSTTFIAQVIRYADGFIFYKSCDEYTTEIDSVRSEEVLSIHRVEPAEAISADVTPRRRTEILGLIGFILLIPSLLGLPPILSITLGIISLIKQKRRPKEFKDKTFAQLSLIIGTILLAFQVYIIILLFT